MSVFAKTVGHTLHIAQLSSASHQGKEVPLVGVEHAQRVIYVSHAPEGLPPIRRLRTPS